MASTYSPTLRIELIGDGDQSGIWGQTTNNNLGSLLEQAITGVATILMTDTNYTLTNYNGVVDEARNAVIVATGTNSAQRDIIAPLVEKTYTIKNSTTGGYAVRIIGPTGTGVVIPNGVTASVFCDGTNFYNLQVGTTGNETINGNLNVTGTATIGGLLTGSTATFSGAISSVSPSFTGVPTAPTAASGTSTTQIATTAFVANSITGLGLGTMSTQNANNVAITGGNINGTVIGGTTRAAGSFTTLTLTTALAVTSGGTGTTTSTGTGSVVLSDSPALTGLPSAPTAIAGTNSTQIATTAFVRTAITNLGTMSTQNANNVAITGGTISGLGTPLPVASGGTGSATATGTGSAVLAASPTLTGTPLAPTAAVGTNTTQIATTAFVASAVSSYLPSGCIVLWSGSVAGIPSGWYLCDGANGTPDLRNRFIVGAGSTYSVGGTGGSADAITVAHTHTYSGTTANGGTHTHGITDPGHSHVYTSADGAAGTNMGGPIYRNPSAVTSVSTTGITINSGGDHNHTFSGTTNSSGSSGTNANLPPYYALCYIMKA